MRCRTREKRRTSALPPAQTWIVDRYATNANFVAQLGSSVVDLLAPKPEERILDLGCGDGALTEKLVAAGSPVVGAAAAAATCATIEGGGPPIMSGSALPPDGRDGALVTRGA